MSLETFLSMNQQEERRRGEDSPKFFFPSNSRGGEGLEDGRSSQFQPSFVLTSNDTFTSLRSPASILDSLSGHPSSISHHPLAGLALLLTSNAEAEERVEDHRRDHSSTLSDLPPFLASFQGWIVRPFSQSWSLLGYRSVLY